MADILVATRNDSRSALDAQIDYLEEKYDGKIYHLSSPSIEISSNDIRKDVAMDQVFISSFQKM